MQTVRMRLTLLYGGLFLVTGVVLVVLVYLLVAHSPFPPRLTPPAVDLPPPPGFRPPQPPGIDAVQARLDQQRADDLTRLLVSSGVALVVMAGLAVALGWWMAGRVLRPLGVMTATVRRISADDLGQRLAAPGPDDELKELADTFDELLDRLEAAFAAQRRFVANASHELRTPLTLQRTTIEVALADPDASGESLRGALRRLLASGEQQERLIEALLTLAGSQQGLARREGVALDELARAAIDASGTGAVRITADLRPALVSGDPELLARLVANLLDNAVRYNVPDGWVAVSTTSEAGRVELRVANSGPPVAADEVGSLIEPFRRLGPERTSVSGHGLGLSIVAAVADAHDGTVRLDPRPDGGLDVVIGFPDPRQPTAA